MEYGNTKKEIQQVPGKNMLSISKPVSKVLALMLISVFLVLLSSDLVFGLDALEEDADHDMPYLFHDEDAEDEVDPFYELYQGQLETFYINSNKSEGVTVVYNERSDLLCDMIDEETGEMECEVTHEVLTGTSEPAETEIKNKSIRIEADDEEGTLLYRDHNFTLVPVNQQAFFDDPEDIPDQNIIADDIWTKTLTGKDMELDYPLNWTVTAESVEGDEIIPFIDFNAKNENHTEGELFFNNTEGYATNEFSGEWNVTVNLTDSEGYNESRLASQENFILDIESTNFPPEFDLDIEEEAPSAEQFQPFQLDINATDPDVNDTLTFSVEKPSDSNDFCDDDLFIWDEYLNTTSQNASNATAEIKVDNLTIEHVACRYVDFVVKDQEDGEDRQENVFLNITNVNQPPEIHELSENGNISDQQALLYSPYSYQVNASDPDELTYAAEEDANLSYSTDSEIFSIEEETGVISFLKEEDNYTGNHTFNVTVSDGEYNDTKEMNLEIKENSPPILEFEQGQEFSQNDEILINISGRDEFNLSMDVSFESLTDFEENVYDFEIINKTYGDEANYTWQANLTILDDLKEANEQVGHHSLNLTLEDESGAIGNESTGTMNFTILNENDAPFFIEFPGSNEEWDVEFGTVVEDNVYEQTIYARDYDLMHDEDFANETLEFEVVNHSDSLVDVELDERQEDRADLSFEPTELGNKNITLNVTDSEGKSDIQTVEFEVLGETDDPEIHEIKPYMNESESLTEEFISTSEFEDNQTELSSTVLLYASFEDEQCSQATINTAEEDLSYTFDINATVDQENASDNNTLSIDWKVNGETEEYKSNVEPKENSSFEYFVDIKQNQTVNITAVAEDDRAGLSKWTWVIDFETGPTNTPPIYCEGSLENIEANSTTTYSDYFSYRSNKQRFYHLNDDDNRDGIRHEAQGEENTLEYSFEDEDDCSIADFEFNGDDLRIIPIGVTGECIDVRFNAVNPQGENVVSDTVNISVQSTEDERDDDDDDDDDTGTSETSTTVPMPLEEEVDVPEPIRVVFPGNATIYEDRTISVPVRLENTWDGSLTGIDLSARMPGQENVSWEFGRDYISVMREEDVIDTNLELEGYREQEGPYEILVDVDVDDPEFNDSASILVSSLEQRGDGDDAQVLVTFARDLLNEQSECQELNTYLEEANNLIEQGNTGEAAELTDQIINSCRYLMAEGFEEDVRLETPGAIRDGINFSQEHSDQILVWSVILTLVVLICISLITIKQKLTKVK